MAYIEFEHLNKFFGQQQVLSDINLGIEHGELVTILGPSGCGKSTLLRCLAGLETVTSGKIFLENREITHLEPQRREVGMVFQQYSLFPNMTAAQNVAFGLKLQGLKKQVIAEKVNAVMETVGLLDRLKHYPRQLSGGQQQRVALARAIVMEPKVLLLDEPLSSIDAQLRKNLQTEIRRIQKKLEITTLFVTHDQDEAMVMSDRIHLFNIGQIEQSGTPVEVYTSPRTKFAAAFIGHYNLIPVETFNKLAGASFDCLEVGIRPEVILISDKPDQIKPHSGGEVINIAGVVRGSTSHGNIIRYTIDCSGTMLDADALFGASIPFASGDKVFLSIDPERILPLAA